MDPFLGEIRMVAFNFAPQGWALCNGQILAIAQNQALFALLGTTYGGNGTTTFALPNLQGRVPVHQGQLSGGSSYTMGQTAGSESVALNVQQMPIHNHTLTGSNSLGSTANPTGAFIAQVNTGGDDPASSFAAPPGQPAVMANSIGQAGGSQPHPNLQPYQVVSFIIATQGIFPSRP